jgi:hypothetical protein
MFCDGSYQTGDYWLIPARTATGDIEWPRTDDANPIPQSPIGIKHHYCRLAVINAAQTNTQVTDCRRLFDPLTEQIRFFHVGGDGQETTPNQPFPDVIRVGVANGQQPVTGAQVLFEEFAPANTPYIGCQVSADKVTWSAQVTATTDSEGVAQCWVEAAGTVGPVLTKATISGLPGPGLRTPHVPIYVNGNIVEAFSIDLDELRADGVVRKNSVGVLGFAVSTDGLLGVNYTEGVAYVAGQRFDINAGSCTLDDNASPQRLYVNSSGVVVLDKAGGAETTAKHAMIAEFSTSGGKIVENIDRRFDMTHLDSKVLANTEQIATKRGDRRQFVPLLANTLPNLQYRDGRNYTFQPGFQPNGLAFDGQSVWVAGARIAWIDASTPGPLKLLRVGRPPFIVVPTPGPAPTPIFVTPPTPASAPAPEPTPSPTLTPDPTPAQASISALPETLCAAFDGDTHVWFTSAKDGTVVIVNKDDHTWTRLAVGQGPFVAIALAGDYMWVADWTNSKLKVMNIHSQQVQPIEIKLGCQPTCLAYDGQNLWIGGEQSASGANAPGGGIYMLPDANHSEIWDSGAVKSICTLTYQVRDMTFDGSHMWYATDSVIGKIDAIEQKDANMSSNIKGAQGLIFDGCHMWAVGAGMCKIDTETGVSLEPFPVPEIVILPHGVFDGSHLWVLTSQSAQKSEVVKSGMAYQVMRILVG